MSAWQRLEQAAQVFERHQHTVSASLAREMAKDALAMETHFAGSDLYSHWASQLEQRAMELETPREPRAAQEAAGHRS